MYSCTFVAAGLSYPTDRSRRDAAGCVCRVISHARKARTMASFFPAAPIVLQCCPALLWCSAGRAVCSCLGLNSVVGLVATCRSPFTQFAAHLRFTCRCGVDRIHLDSLAGKSNARYISFMVTCTDGRTWLYTMGMLAWQTDGLSSYSPSLQHNDCADSPAFMCLN